MKSCLGQQAAIGLFRVLGFAFLAVSPACNSSISSKIRPPQARLEAGNIIPPADSGAQVEQDASELPIAAKLIDPNCVDPDLTRIPIDVSLMLCDGTMAVGSLDLASLTAENLRAGITVAGIRGRLVPTALLCASDGENSCVVDGTTSDILKSRILIIG